MERMTAGLKAVLFDVDGTLYSQAPLRVLMAAELVLHTLHGRSPQRALQLARVLRTFRSTREALREEGAAARALEDVQFEATASRLDLEVADVRRVVNEWILERPLRHMRRARRPGLQRLLSTLAERGLQVGALSDYPVGAKLEALGVAGHFSLGLCTTDRAINAFKPHPQGFRRACEVWGIGPQEVLYVGDRPEIDGVGAAAAGMRCVIVGRSRGHDRSRRGEPALVRAFSDLRRAFAGT
jgi:HAD superfamily hydrolase (TIGR01549 family)